LPSRASQILARGYSIARRRARGAQPQNVAAFQSFASPRVVTPDIVKKDNFPHFRDWV